ncbi:sporulation protein [Methylotenera sp.]|uniref:sporulation protein n=1 Tax=Methylotenera sp. TaxID=2051956 RepID=UPI002730EAF7|nr:sporulation protein [Methylotenera sp.]MDP2231083.1 sporulation protein [Methylotenera sp.]MDP3140215.1 sporulation protein [Methylotenera sp.]
MKKLVWLLVLINLALLTYFNLDVVLPSAPNSAMTAIHPEKIVVLSPQQIATLPKKSPNSTTSKVTTAAASTIDVTIREHSSTVSPALASNTCYEWGVFSAVNLTGAQIEASKLSLQATVKEQTSLEAKRFWVYKKPLRSAEAAQAKAQELKALGVDDLYVVQDAKWKNAISFGIFEDEQLAIKLLNELRAKGVKDVSKALRNQSGGHASLLFSKLNNAEVLELKKLKSQFPEADVKEVRCN